MRKDEVFEGKYLKHQSLLVPGSSDEYRSMVLTITGPVVWSEQFSDGNRQRVIGFKEIDKKLGLNKTNWNSIAKITKQDDDDKWEGSQIEVWVDENIAYGGEIVSGIRIRKPTGQANGTLAALKSATGSVAGSDLPPLAVASKATAWASWKRAALACKDTGDDLAARFKTACDIEAANSKTPIDNFGAINWGNVAEKYQNPATVIDDSDIPF